MALPVVAAHDQQIPDVVVAASSRSSVGLEGPEVRRASAQEVYNIPLFEVPPMLDVRAGKAFEACRSVCAVSVPWEDGPDAARALQRILDHDENFGWCLQHPFVIVYDDETEERASWLTQVLKNAIKSHFYKSYGPGLGTAPRGEELLCRLARQCKKILLLHYPEFKETFPHCIAHGGVSFADANQLFEDLGPLPRCALVTPRVYLAGRQVKLTERLLSGLGVTDMVVNADWRDVMDGTSGGHSRDTFRERPPDVAGVRYLKCDIPDDGGNADTADVLLGAANFLAQCAGRGGIALVSMHGQSRSSAVICAYLVVALGHSVEKAWQVVAAGGMQLDESLVWWGALENLQGRAPQRGIANA